MGSTPASSMGRPFPWVLPLARTGWVGMEGLAGGNGWLRRVFYSILKVDFFTLTFRQLERLVRGSPLPWVPVGTGDRGEVPG